VKSSHPLKTWLSDNVIWFGPSDLLFQCCLLQCRYDCLLLAESQLYEVYIKNCPITVCYITSYYPETLPSNHLLFGYYTEFRYNTPGQGD
jgi:hypothetical protein